ncbi:unnamed protein product [Periconia digitata]|uniref:Uncharacterized protein n=1 Tax=Periconia digitata TaxID=1303443 RepID=A0A9W4XNG2_9PLEO|nr:unnamed protein product [Periconia digitata]
MVYITRELFGSDPAYQRSASPLCTIMKDTEHAAAGLGKRKRRIDDESLSRDIQYESIDHTPFILNTYTSRSSCSPHPSPSHKSPVKDYHQGFNPVSTPTYVDAERRPVKQTRRSIPKLAKEPSYLMDVEQHHTSNLLHTNAPRVNTNFDLRPCHSCCSAPKRKQDLENYMECKHCDGRTCFICARECISCKKAICNRCIVEVGEEGDSWCLECHQRQINS